MSTALKRNKCGYREINALMQSLLGLASVAETGPVNAVAASLQTALTGNNNDLTITAKVRGAAGNNFSLTLTNPGTPSAALGVQYNAGNVNVNLATDAGTAQVETATAAGTVTGSGNAKVIVTGAGIAGSPLTIEVAVLNGDVAATWAGKVRTALGNTAAITALYTVGGAGTAISLTRKVATANDGTLNIELDNDDSTGITHAASSANTTAGVAPAITSTAGQVAAALQADDDFNANLTVANKSGNDGSGVVTALAQTPLAGGVDGTPGEPMQIIYTTGFRYVNVSEDDNQGTATNTWYKDALTLVT